MYTTGYRYAGIYRQSRVLTVIYNCSFPGRTPRRWWTGPTASATTSHVTATTGSSAPDPTTGNASAVCTYAAPFLHRGLRRMCVWVILRYVYAGLLSSYIFMSATAASIITKSCVSHPNPFIICIQGPFWSVGTYSKYQYGFRSRLLKTTVKNFVD